MQRKNQCARPLFLFPSSFPHFLSLCLPLMLIPATLQQFYNLTYSKQFLLHWSMSTIVCTRGFLGGHFRLFNVFKKKKKSNIKNVSSLESKIHKYRFPFSLLSPTIFHEYQYAITMQKHLSKLNRLQTSSLRISLVCRPNYSGEVIKIIAPCHSPSSHLLPWV